MKKKKAGKTTGLILAVLLILSGALVFLYPRYTDWQYRNEVNDAREDFMVWRDTGNEDKKNTALEELYRELKRRNEKLYTERQKGLRDPFSYEQPAIDLSAYGLEENRIGFLSIPKMDIELPILLGANEENMSSGAVHLTGTSYPIGGVNTNCVIAAHRGYSRTAMFRDIEALEVGDKIYIENFREKLTYQVTELRIIKPTDIDQLLIQEGKDMVTLVTCHPYGYNYQRYVVFCERVKN